MGNQIYIVSSIFAGRNWYLPERFRGFEWIIGQYRRNGEGIVRNLECIKALRAIGWALSDQTCIPAESVQLFWEQQGATFL